MKTQKDNLVKLGIVLIICIIVSIISFNMLQIINLNNDCMIKNNMTYKSQEFSGTEECKTDGEDIECIIFHKKCGGIE